MGWKALLKQNGTSPCRILIDGFSLFLIIWLFRVCCCQRYSLSLFLSVSRPLSLSPFIPLYLSLSPSLPLSLSPSLSLPLALPSCLRLCVHVCFSACVPTCFSCARGQVFYGEEDNLLLLVVLLTRPSWWNATQGNYEDGEFVWL